MGKGEIARYEQFLLFPQCFQKARFPGASKGVIVWEWVKLPSQVKVNKQFRKNILLLEGWLVVLWFNATLTSNNQGHIMVVADTRVS